MLNGNNVSFSFTVYKEHSYWHIHLSTCDSETSLSAANKSWCGQIQQWCKRGPLTRNGWNFYGSSELLQDSVRLIKDRCKYFYHHLHQFSIVAQLLTTYSIEWFSLLILLIPYPHHTLDRYFFLPQFSYSPTGCRWGVFLNSRLLSVSHSKRNSIGMDFNFNPISVSKGTCFN